MEYLHFSEKFGFTDTSGKSAIKFVGLKLTPFVAVLMRTRREFGALLFEACQEL